MVEPEEMILSGTQIPPDSCKSQSGISLNGCRGSDNPMSGSESHTCQQLKYEYLF